MRNSHTHAYVRRPTSSAINRTNRQREIDKENLKFLKKLQSAKPSKECTRSHLFQQHTKNTWRTQTRCDVANNLTGGWGRGNRVSKADRALSASALVRAMSASSAAHYSGKGKRTPLSDPAFADQSERNATDRNKSVDRNTTTDHNASRLTERKDTRGKISDRSQSRVDVAKNTSKQNEASSKEPDNAGYSMNEFDDDDDGNGSENDGKSIRRSSTASSVTSEASSSSSSSTSSKNSSISAKSVASKNSSVSAKSVASEKSKTPMKPKAETESERSEDGSDEDEGSAKSIPSSDSTSRNKRNKKYKNKTGSRVSSAVGGRSSVASDGSDRSKESSGLDSNFYT